MANHNTKLSDDLTPAPTTRRPKWTSAWAIAVLAAVLFLAGSWYWNARPAQVQAAISEARSTTNRSDVMTVEAISEGGVTLVGRTISIVNARVMQVSGPRTFWVGGNEGEPLLVLMARGRDDAAEAPALEIAVGERVSINGVLRLGVDGDVPAKEDRAHVSKEPLHLAATAVQKADR